MKEEKKRFLVWKLRNGMPRFKKIRAGILLAALFLTLGASSVKASSYGGDYRFWSQGGSDYQGMREVGCLITAQAKMLYEANVIRDASFNPDAWYNWLVANGKIAGGNDLNMRDHAAPAQYAGSVGKQLEYLGKWNADDVQLWFNINQGYYTIVHVSGANTGGSHFVLLDNAMSRQTGVLYCYDSFSDRGTVAQQRLSRYGRVEGGHVFKGNNPVHSHSYTSDITRQPACEQAGVRTYRCSCGAAYEESIPATGHRYKDHTVAPTWTMRGYTVHDCADCGHSYQDEYIDPPKQGGDGWYYGAAVPDGTSEEEYEIQYQNCYQKIQQSSPGAGWTQEGVERSEWQDVGSPYESEEDLQTSDARALVRSVFYHFCGPNAGNEGNYELAGKFVHYDEILASSVTARYLGTDNGHPYYFIDWNDGGGQVWCRSGVSCDGSYGSHGNRCRAWYKKNTYQDRKQIVFYQFTKKSDWTTQADEAASEIKIRLKKRDAQDQEPDGAKPDEGKPSIKDPDKEKPGGTKPSTGGAKPNAGGTKPGTGGAKPNTGGSKPAAGGGGSNGSQPSVKVPSVSKVRLLHAKSGKKRLRIFWKKVSGAAGYQIQIDTKKSFSKPKNISVSGSKQSYMKKGLKAKKKYYVRIRAYKSYRDERGVMQKSYGAWAKTSKKTG